MLTEEKKEQFWKDGVIEINDVLSTKKVAQLASAADLVASQLPKSDADEATVHHFLDLENDLSFRDLARSPELISKVTSLLGKNIQIHHSKLVMKPMFEDRGGICWHQDFPFFPHTNTSLVAIMVMLDDATPENGCMYVVPGSHKLGPLDHHVDGWFTGCNQEPLPDNDLSHYSSDPIAVTPTAGGISIHHCLTLHMSPPNLSGRSRRGLVFQYRSSDAHALAGSLVPECGWQVSGSYDGKVRCEEAIWKLPKKFLRKGGGGTEIGYGDVWNQIGTGAKAWNPPFEAVSEKAKQTQFHLKPGKTAKLDDLKEKS